MTNLATCIEETEWGQCQQEAPAQTWPYCGFHLRDHDSVLTTRDRYYERKVVLGLIEPTDHYLDQVEIEAMFGGRPRHDGRRIDEYTL